MAITPRIVDSDHIELRRYKQPLPQWVRVVGFFIGVATAGGVTAGGAMSLIGPMAVKAAGGALDKEVEPRFKGLGIQIEALAKVVQEQSDIAKLDAAEQRKAHAVQASMYKEILRRLPRRISDQ
jgi:hypothetical protein